MCKKAFVWLLQPASGKSSMVVFKNLSDLSLEVILRSSSSIIIIGLTPLVPGTRANPSSHTFRVQVMNDKFELDGSIEESMEKGNIEQ